MHTELVTIETDTLPLDGALYEPSRDATVGFCTTPICERSISCGPRRAVSIPVGKSLN
jgi:hypothetical protein